MMASACCKHYVANEMDGSTVDGVHWDRMHVDSAVPIQDLVDSYMPPFQVRCPGTDSTTPSEWPWTGMCWRESGCAVRSRRRSEGTQPCQKVSWGEAPHGPGYE